MHRNALLVLVGVVSLALIACSDDDPINRPPSRQDGGPVDDGGGNGDGIGGDSTAGDPAGGDTSGGDTTGGDASGGDATGGDATGGDATGGDATGGDATGGDATGGDATAGDAGLPASTVCTLTPGVRNHLLLRGDILQPSGFLAGGELLVVDGMIACVDVDCTGAAEAADATILDCPQSVISPGLINAHDHIGFTQAWPSADTGERYDHRHEWRTGANGGTRIRVSQNSHGLGDSWGEMRQVLAGTTSLFGSGTVPGFLRNLDRASALEGLNHGAARYNTFPLDDNSGTLALSGCDVYTIDDPAQAMGYVAYVPHVSEGIGASARNELLCMSGTVAGSQDLIFETAAFIHGIGVNPADINLMAAEGTGLVWSPRSNTRLYGHTAMAPLYDRIGARIALGTDWTASGSVDILRELSCARDWNNIYWGGYFSDADLVAMATEWAAEILGFQDILGTLMPGKAADITIWDASVNSGYSAVLDAELGDVALVLRGGVPLHGDAALVGPLTSAGDCEAIDVCGVAKALCAPREIQTTTTLLAAELDVDTYPLGYCGTPVDEPSCTPMRSGEFDGLPNSVVSPDLDADGVDDGVDNCVGIFNPGRPLDGGLQSDFDADSVGDACDPCPLDAATTVCSAFDPDDRDNDGEPNLTDNCPWDPNPAQLDDDGDLKGNVCDPCPNDYNPGADGCPTTIYQVKDGSIPVGQRVTIPEAVVTAVGAEGFFMQTDPASLDYAGVDFSAVYVYDPGVVQPARGDTVSVDGVVADYFTQLELTGPTVSVLPVAPVTLTPEPIDPADAAVGGLKFAEYEALLVSVSSVTVTDIAPVGEVGEAVENEFLITGNLSVDDYLYWIAPYPAATDVIPGITGVVRRHWQRNKLLPRDVFDVDLGPPTLSDFGPSGVILYEGVSGSSAPALFVSVSPFAQSDITVPISSSNPSLLSVTGGEVIVLANGTQAEVLFDTPTGPGGPVTLTATLGLDVLTADVTVLPSGTVAVPIELDPPLTIAALDQTILYTVTLDLPAPPGGQLVTLAATGASVSIPTDITVPFFATSASFDVTAGTTAGEAYIDATVDTTTVSATLSIVDAPPVGLLLAEVLYDVGGDDNNREWVKLYNGTGGSVDLAAFSLGWGGTNYTYGKQQLAGTVAAGECFIVGGPTSDATNFNPVLDQAQDFANDIQNSGTTADGVALFDVPATSIGATTVPIDNVVYGSTNGNGLLDPSGATSLVHVGDAPSDSSLLRTTVTDWIISATPNIQACFLIQ